MSTEIPCGTRGYFERLDCLDNKINISGWMLHSTENLDTFTLYINGAKVGETKPIEREDVAKTFPFISYSKDVGFSFTIDKCNQKSNELLDIRVTGFSKGRDVANMETWFLADLYNILPVPPSHLISRVAGNEGSSFYFVTGIQNYKDFWKAVCKHGNPNSIKTMLDWGCGSGRMIGFFLKFSGIPRVFGCDIDAEAIAWCQEHLKSAEFNVIPPYPPTVYADRMFDLIISFSVFTHLSRDVQSSWLREMQRILSPGGLFIASVHGEFATAFNFQDKSVKDVLKNGIHEVADERLDGVAPEGYYRGVFQSKEYTLREFGKFFEIVEYKEQGGSNYQDLVVMRRPPS